MIKIVYDDVACMVIGSIPIIESALTQVFKEIVEVLDEEGEAAGTKIERNSTEIFRVLNVANPRVIQTHHGYTQRLIGLLRDAQQLHTVIDNRKPFPLPKLENIHGCRGSQERLLKAALIQNCSGCISAPTRFGKCLDPMTPVMMHDGSMRLAYEVSKGDLLMGEHGQPVRVLNTVYGTDVMYQVIPAGGLPWKCTGDHILVTNRGNIRADAVLARFDQPELRMRKVLGASVPYREVSPSEYAWSTLPDWHRLPLPELERQFWAMVAKYKLDEGDTHNTVICLPRPAAAKADGLRTKHTHRDWQLANACARLGIWCDFLPAGAHQIKAALRIKTPNAQAALFEPEVHEAHFKVEPAVGDSFYGFEVEGGLFLLADGTLTHNTTLIVNTIRAYPDVPTLVTLPGIDLCVQLHADLQQALPHLAVGLYVSGKKKIRSDRLVVCSLDSLSKMDAAHWKLLIVDEPHAAVTDARMEDIVEFDRARKLAFGATLGGRFDNRDSLIEGLFGPVLSKISYKEAVAEGSICQIVALLVVVRLDVDTRTHFFSRNQAYDYMLLLSARARANLKWIFEQLLPDDWQAMAFIKTEKQAEFYAEVLKDVGGLEIPIAMAKRYSKVKDRQIMFEKIRDAYVKRVLASGIFAQGVTFPDIRVIVNMAGGGPYQSAVQKPGRLAQVRPGKKTGLLIDFVYRPAFSIDGIQGQDIWDRIMKSFVGQIIREGESRKKVYQETGYTVLEVGGQNAMRRAFEALCL